MYLQGVVDGTPASRGYQGGFASRLMVKDLGLAKAAAQHVSMDLPMGQAALQLYEQVHVLAFPGPCLVYCVRLIVPVVQLN